MREEREVLRFEREMLAHERASFTADRLRQQEVLAETHKSQQESGKQLEVMRWELGRLCSELLDPTLAPPVDHAAAVDAESRARPPSNGVIGVNRPLENEAIEVLIAEFAERLREGTCPALAQAYLRRLGQERHETTSAQHQHQRQEASHSYHQRQGAGGSPALPSYFARGSTPAL